MKCFAHQKIVIIIAIIFTFILVSIHSCSPQKNVDSFRFVFMTDIHIMPEMRGAEGFSAAIAKANELNPDFVITGGDLVKDALGQTFERSTQLYDMYIDLCKQFKMPVYNTIGNHEVFGLYEKSGVDSTHPEFGKQMYKNRIGNNPSYYSYNHKNWHFIILDAIGYTKHKDYYGNIDSVQMDWIKSDLQNIDPQTPIVISTHIPFISAEAQIQKGGIAALEPYEVVGNSNEVLKLFKNYNLKLVLQGHLHIVEEIIYKDVHFITGGAVSAAWWGGPYKGFPEGFVVVDAENDNFNWTYQTFNWKAEK